MLTEPLRPLRAASRWWLRSHLAAWRKAATVTGMLKDARDEYYPPAAAVGPQAGLAAAEPSAGCGSQHRDGNDATDEQHHDQWHDPWPATCRRHPGPPLWPPPSDRDRRHDTRFDREKGQGDPGQVLSDQQNREQPQRKYVGEQDRNDCQAAARLHTRALGVTGVSPTVAPSASPAVTAPPWSKRLAAVPSTSGCCWMGRARARQSRVCRGAQQPGLPGMLVVAGRTADPRIAPGWW